MPDSESFDAFYARTVWRVTSQMHELAGDDGLADHAIREAYAKAYQQWYQVSGYRDSEGWVLATATEAYERRRAETAGPGHHAAAEASDAGTWPGIYRPRPDVDSRRAGLHQRPADPEATMSPGYPAAGAAAMGALTADGAAAGTGASAAGPGPLAAGAAEPAGFPRRGGPTRPGGRLGGGVLGRPGSRRTALVAGAVIAALLIAGITYLATGGHKAKATASQGTSPKVAAKPKPHMLRAGQTGRRSAIPWSLVGAGWALAESSTAQPNSAGEASGTGTYTTYLVDPKGGKYEVTTSSGGAEPQLMAWSGNANEALFSNGGTSAGAGSAGATSYSLLTVATGRLAPLPLPAGVAAVGFTRPDGLAILAVHQGPAQFHLQRYTLTGQLQASSLASLPRKQGESWPSDGCSSACALSSPQGTFDAWGIAGDEMEVLSNAGGKPIKVHVPASGHRSSCIPLSWWDDSTILADCAAAGLPDDGAGLWLVPASGGSAESLTAASGSPAGNGDIEGAWQAGSTTYVTSTTFSQCQNAPSGPGGVDILRLGQGSNTTVTIPGSTNNANRIVGSYGNRLLVLAQTTCPGTSSLLWFSPSTGTGQIVLTAPGTEVGVVAAVPFGNGPTVTSSQD
jgi:hypothetical protein